MNDDLYIAGAASCLPAVQRVRDAVAAGLLPAAEAAQTAMESITVAAVDQSGPQMAASAARSALRRSGLGSGDIGLVLHATLYDQGHDLWSSAAYVQRHAVAGDHAGCPALEIRQVSNGGMAAIQLGSAYLRAGTERPAALLTSGDVFCEPGFDRWRSDPGTIYADGGTALVLSRSGGFARLRSIVSVSEPRLEAMHRGAQSFRPSDSGRRRVDLDGAQRHFLEHNGRAATIGLLAGGARRAVTDALAAAGVEQTQISRFVLPHLGHRRLAAGYLRPFNIAVEQSTWSWSRTVGHLGAGDQFAGLTHLIESKSVSPGEFCLLLGVGAGFSWSGAVVEILELPAWADKVPTQPGAAG